MNRNIAVILSAKTSGFKAQMVQAAGTIKGFEKDVQSAGSRTSKIGAGLKAAFMGLAVAAALFFGNAINQAVQFEGAMRNVNSISMLSEKQLASLSNQVLNLSTKVPQTAQQLAEGLYDIASSGFQGAAGLKVLEASALAASAGLTTTEVSANAITQVLNAYGLAAADATDVSDVLFQTVNLGVVSFEELASQLGDVVGGAAAAGVAIDEVGAAVAAMTLSGVGAAESTTSLNNLIRSLIKPSDGLAAAYQNLGIESGEAALQEHGLYGVMELLRESTGGNITTLLKLFPEIRAARGAFALMANNGENYAKTFDGIADKTNRAGATQRAFNEQMKGLGQQWKLFTNELSAASIKLGTALIPVLKQGLIVARDFGGTLGDVVSSAAAKAAPAFERLWEAAQQVWEAFKTVAQVLRPVAQGLAVVGGAAILGSLYALASAVDTLGGFLADHEGLVKAVAAVYGTVLVMRLASAASAFIKLQASLMYIRAGLAALSAQALLGNLITRVTALGIGLKGLFTGNVVAQTLGLGTAFAGISTALAGLATGAAVVGLYAITTGLMNAKQNATELVNTVNKGLDKSSLESINDALERNEEAWVAAASSAQSYKGIGGVLKGTLELLTPLENELLDSSEATKALAENAEELERMETNLSATVGMLSQQFHISIEEAERLATQLKLTGEIDPFADGAWDQIEGKVKDFLATTADVPPSMTAMADATGEVADITSTAADKVGALEDALKGLFGVAINAREAEAGLAEAIAELGNSVEENGLTFDVWTEKGRNNEEALRGNVEAMIDLANATAAESNSVADGVAVLGLYREQLLNNLTSMGMSKSAAEDLLATYGLTPENLETLVSLEGADTASDALTDIEGMMKAISETQAEGTVNLNTEDFDGDKEAINAWIEQIAIAAPEATVTLDDEPFVATAAQVQAWADKYDSSSPEASALLNMIDPQHKYSSLDNAAAHWEDTHTTGTASLDDRAAGPLGANARRLRAWNSSRGIADADVRDMASGPLGGIRTLLAQIDGYVAHATVQVTAQGASAARIAAGKDRRWGGIDYAAADGMAWQAGVTMNPTILYGERETGGEAFIPRLGMRDRSVGILKTAADWYGMDVVPRGSNSYMGLTGGGGGMVINMPIDVRVRADAGVDTTRLTKMVGKAVQVATADQAKQLRRLLKVR